MNQRLILDNQTIDVQPSRPPDISGKVVLYVLGIERLRLKPEEAVWLASALLEVAIPYEHQAEA